jgi:hypothetical protein
MLPVDKTYKLINGLSPLSYTIPSRNTRNMPLLHFDEKNNVNRVLRYARNQKSPFEDEQDGNFILEPVVFEDGFLFVPRTNPVLQQFLHYHPWNGTVFAEVDKERDAQKEVENLDLEVDALIRAKALTMAEMETLARVIFGVDPDKMSSNELKRDIMLYSRRSPKDFLEAINDKTLTMQADVHKMFTAGLLSFRKNKSEVYFNLKNNKSKMINVPYGHDGYDATVRYFQSEEGIEKFNMLSKMLSDDSHE